MADCARGVQDVRVTPIRAAQPTVVVNCAPAAPFAAVPGAVPTTIPGFPQVAVTGPFVAQVTALTAQQQVALNCLAQALGIPAIQLQTVAATLGVDPITLGTTLLGAPTPAVAGIPGVAGTPVFAAGGLPFGTVPGLPGIAGVPAAAAGFPFGTVPGLF